MPIAKEGWPLILAAAALAVLALLLRWQVAGIALALLTLAIAAFFRDPERDIPTGDGLVVSPADGRVVTVTPVSGRWLVRRCRDPYQHLPVAPRRAYQSRAGGRPG